MTGGASNLTLRLVMSRNKLENVSLGVRIDNLVEDSIILPLDWAQKSWFRNMCNTALYVHYLLRYMGRGAESAPPPSNLYQKKISQPAE